VFHRRKESRSRITGSKKGGVGGSVSRKRIESPGERETSTSNRGGKRQKKGEPKGGGREKQNSRMAATQWSKEGEVAL